jgi:hypothetical protein
MQPQQPYYQPPSQTNNPYDFIFQDNTPKRSLGGGDQKKTLIIFGAVVLGVIGLLIIILSLAFRGSGGDVAPYISIAKQQAEMIRITVPANEAEALRTQTAKNLATNAQAVLKTDQKSLLDLLSKNGTKIGEKELAAVQNADTDAALEAAKTTGTYDTTYIDTMQAYLKTYQQTLKLTYPKATTSTEKDLLTKEYDNATLLLEQSSE